MTVQFNDIQMRIILTNTGRDRIVTYFIINSGNEISEVLRRQFAILALIFNFFYFIICDKNSRLTHEQNTSKLTQVFVQTLLYILSTHVTRIMSRKLTFFVYLFVSDIITYFGNTYFCNHIFQYSS